MNPAAALRQQALAQPDHPAILWEGGALTYGEMEDRVARMAGGLLGRLAPGSHVALVMENCPEFLPALYAIWRAGMVAVPVNAKLHAREHAWILENAEVALCLASPALADALGDETHRPLIAVGTPLWDALDGSAVHETETRPDDLAWLFYTSGTTGRPKGAMITYRNLMAASWAYLADVDFIGPDDIRLHAAPLTHGSGLYAVPFVAKGAQNLIPPSGFKPEQVFEILSTRRQVSFFAAPTMVSRLINHPLADRSDHPGLKTLEYGGAPMYLADLKRALEVFGPRLYHLYGQGEAPMTITHVPKALHADTAHPRYWARLATTGVPRSGCEVRIVGPKGPLPPGATGEIATRSDAVVSGYWRNPEATAKTIRDGWLMTGDVGSLDDECFLTIKDRSKDMVISGGMNIYPREIEEVLLTHPGVTECSVVGRADPEWGEALVAFVVGTASAAELDRLCLDNLARFKRPKDWRFVESLPKNNYGKIVKTELRAMLEAGG